jgi:hypothetical protein
MLLLSRTTIDFIDGKIWKGKGIATVQPHFLALSLAKRGGKDGRKEGKKGLFERRQTIGSFWKLIEMKREERCNRTAFLAKSEKNNHSKTNYWVQKAAFHSKFRFYGPIRI